MLRVREIYIIVSCARFHRARCARISAGTPPSLPPSVSTPRTLMPSLGAPHIQTNCTYTIERTIRSRPTFVNGGRGRESSHRQLYKRNEAAQIYYYGSFPSFFIGVLCAAVPILSTFHPSFATTGWRLEFLMTSSNASSLSTKVRPVYHMRISTHGYLFVVT